MNDILDDEFQQMNERESQGEKEIPEAISVREPLRRAQERPEGG